MDYYFEVERFDRESGNILHELERLQLMQNTLVIMTSDNGMPFPRAKANLYDYGTRMPLAIYWKGKITPIKKVEDFINFIDFGPTILEATGIEIPKGFSGTSFMDLLEGQPNGLRHRDTVFLERERHANVRKGDLAYPSRAVRTKEYLYIRNFEPDRWPAGDPNAHQSVGQYGDVDNSITKFLIMRDSLGEQDYFRLAFGKRPQEELYLLKTDPFNLKNEADNEKYNEVLAILRKSLSHWMLSTGDLRATEPRTGYWDEVKFTPNYQYHNYDLEEKIKAYTMMAKEGGRLKENPCIP